MSRRIEGTKMVGRFLLTLLIVFCPLSLSAQSANWGYRLGVAVDQQQANFCSSKSEILRIAEVFEQDGPRPGYYALSNSKLCALAVKSFTPLESVAEIEIPVSEGEPYKVSFLEVRYENGSQGFLVTTRSVAP